MIEQSFAIIQRSVDEWQPRQVVCLFSGGYDSLVTAHIAQRWRTVPVWSIDTLLSADGWRDYVCGVGAALGWEHHIYCNEAGYAEFRKWVELQGCPRGRTGHNRAYHRLKERALYRILAHYKQHVSDKVLFLTGIRRAESAARAAIPEMQRLGHSNIIFACPILHWTDVQVHQYRWNNELSENPFYGTVKGSGDCQCNWGNFITLNKLRQHSPVLAAGHVADLDRISRIHHGYGWDGAIEGQASFIADDEAEGFSLCTNCSRAKGEVVAASEWRALQEGV